MQGVEEQVHAIVDDGGRPHDFNDQQGHAVCHIASTQLADGLRDTYPHVEAESPYPCQEEEPSIPVDGHLQRMGTHIRISGRP